MSAVLPLLSQGGISPRDEVAPFAPTISLVALARTYLYDTTLNTGESPGDATVGTRRGQYRDGTSIFYVAPTVHPVTVFEEELNSAGVWVVTNNGGAGDIVAPAAFQRFFFRPITDEHRVYVLNGAIGPTALATDGHWIPKRVDS